MQVHDLTNGVEIPYDSTPGDNWFIGSLSQRDRYLDPEIHDGFYISGGLFYFNQDGSMIVPPGPGDVWEIEAAGPKVPCSGNVYRMDPYGILEGEPASVHSLKLGVSPNPFRGLTEISFTLPRRSDVSLKVYDVAGRAVTCLLNGTLDPGTHGMDWRGLDARSRRVPQGVYFLHLEVDGDPTLSRKMVLLK
jgi:hypothetical protein